MLEDQKISAIVQLGKALAVSDDSSWQATLAQAQARNQWFTPDNITQAIQGIRLFLEEEKIQEWLKRYPLLSSETRIPKKVGVVMAGNIPLVGFHDFLSVLLSGHQLMAKLSSSDEVLLPRIAEMLIEMEPAFRAQIQFVDKLNEADAYIATGSNNSSRYFQYYFGKKPNIIRKNRSSIAILNGEESEADLKALSKDIFQYFGLGCRSISKLYLPANYDFAPLFQAFEEWEDIKHHNKYINNYTYHKAILLMDEAPHRDNGFAILHENERLASPVSVLYYEHYQDTSDLALHIHQLKSELQLVSSRQAWYPESIPFGKSQEPELWDYADGLDTMDFLLNLSRK